ncbi:MAG: outer membrane protein assembly factor BamC [Gammaproteobacteria bacterium]|nr:outer membrane protein assembly factor BamC [Gammaproteobacteria bacterium]
MNTIQPISQPIFQSVFQPIIKATSITLTLLALIACSSAPTTNSSIDYGSSAIAPNLIVPPDLTVPGGDESVNIPGMEIGRASQQDVVEKSRTATSNKRLVLPEIATVKIKGEGKLRWLVVDAEPDVLYEKLLGFWASQEMTLTTQAPLLGMMETDWIDHKTEAPSSSIFGSFFKSLLTADDNKDRFRTRLERSPIAGKTHVYITHSGLEFMLGGKTNKGQGTLGQAKRKGWQSKPRDIELEAEMLSRVVIYLGLSDEDSRVLLAQAGVEQAGAHQASAYLDIDESGLHSIKTKEAIDRVWANTLNVLDQKGIHYQDIDRAAGTIFVKRDVADDRSKDFFTRMISEKKKKIHDDMVIKIEVLAGNTVTTIRTKEGAPLTLKTAKYFLQFLFDELK